MAIAFHDPIRLQPEAGGTTPSTVCPTCRSPTTSAHPCELSSQRTSPPELPRPRSVKQLPVYAGALPTTHLPRLQHRRWPPGCAGRCAREKPAVSPASPAPPRPGAKVARRPTAAPAIHPYFVLSLRLRQAAFFSALRHLVQRNSLLVSFLWKVWPQLIQISRPLSFLPMP